MRCRFLAFVLPALLPLPALAQDAPDRVDLLCDMAVLCIEASPCQDWGQEIHVTRTDDGAWQVLWEDDLPSDYQLTADIPAPEGALEPTRLRSLLLANSDTQSVQMISIEDGGNMVVTLHQPQARPRAVTGFGFCADSSPSDTEASQ